MNAQQNSVAQLLKVDLFCRIFIGIVDAVATVVNKVAKNSLYRDGSLIRNATTAANADSTAANADSTAANADSTAAKKNSRIT